MPVRTCALVCVLVPLVASCAEYAQFRSTPAPAAVYLNDAPIGGTPLNYPIARNAVKETYNYRIEVDGYEPATGILRRRVAPGRIVAAVFTLCITCAFRGFQYFEPVNATLTPIGKTSTGEAKGTPAERLRLLKDAFDKGMINEREYKRLRSEILGDF
jgi:uncharacterized membrane protein